jgi:hypothetical protein
MDQLRLFSGGPITLPWEAAHCTCPFWPSFSQQLSEINAMVVGTSRSGVAVLFGRTADDFPNFVMGLAEMEHELRKPGTGIDCE